MSLTNRIQVRAAIVGCAIVLLLGAAIPLLVNAQNGTPEAGAQPEVIEQGESVFQDICLACHQANGEGIEGVYPALAGNPLVGADEPDYILTTLMTGRGGMPQFSNLSDEDIAAVASYVRVELNDDAGEVSVEQVADIRDAVYPPAEEDEVVEEATPEDATPEVPVNVPELEEGTPEATPDLDPEATPED